MLRLRKATFQDLEQITAIYNYAIKNLIATFDEHEKNLTERKEWLEQHQHKQYPLVVAEEAGDILGWGSISPFRDRSAYRFTGETSIYVHQVFYGQGVGTRILKELIELTKETQLHTLMAVIAADNQPSIRLHANFGFQIVGQMQQVGYKFGQWIDVLIMQKML